MPSEQFERKIKAKLEGVNPPPPPGLFDAIQAQLTPAPPPRKAFVWWWIGGGSLIAAAIGLVIWLSLPTEPAVANIPMTSLEEHPETSSSPLPTQEELQSEKEALGEDNGTQDVAHVAPAPNRVPSHREDMASSAQQLPLTEQPQSPGSISVLTLAPDHPSDLASEIQQTEMPLPSQLEGKSREILIDSINRRFASTIDLNGEIPYPADIEVPGHSPWYLRVAFQGERASKGNPAWFIAPPANDYTVVEDYGTRALALSIPPVHTVSYPRQRFGVGILMGRELAPRWSTELGLFYSQSEQGVYRRGSADLNLVTGGVTLAADAVRTYEVELSWRQNYLELPLRINYHIWQGYRKRLTLQTGVSLNRRTNQLDTDRSVFSNDELSFSPLPEAPQSNPDDILITSDGTSLLDLKDWHSHVQLGMMYEFGIGPYRQMYLSPTFKYFMQTPYQGTASSDQPRYHVGLEIGLKLGR